VSITTQRGSCTFIWIVCGCKLLHRKFLTCLGQGHMQQPER
jgi:hypothetical protein